MQPRAIGTSRPAKFQREAAGRRRDAGDPGTIEIDGIARMDRSTERAKLGTDPQYLDVHLPAGALFTAPLASGAAHFSMRTKAAPRRRGRQDHACPSCGRHPLRRRPGASPGGGRRRAVPAVVAKPLREPVVQYGPFVMNTREEIEQALPTIATGAWPPAGTPGIEGQPDQQHRDPSRACFGAAMKVFTSRPSVTSKKISGTTG